MKLFFLGRGLSSILSFLDNDLPVVITLAHPLCGHSVLDIGYESESDQIIFADPATGTKRLEMEFLESTKKAFIECIHGPTQKRIGSLVQMHIVP